ncbi:MAG TPA: nucleotidyl transferase AbiEii/AbiGii toxin family protein [Candidatus Aminicenantes bacterium]|nr:nucleotidyl transferase AbiEii/AbiGii toxin family protein [Candidatus Aminicenantes bacterium]
MLDLPQIESYFPEPLRAFKRNLLREYLHYKLLEIIYDSKLGNRLAFLGGTAIHIVHGAPRFSEDLDFDDRGMSEGDFRSLERLVKSGMEMQGYPVETAAVSRAARRIIVRFPGLFHLYGLSTNPREKLHLHIDAEPQRFDYRPEAVLIDKFDVFGRILVTPSDLLLAQKIACLFTRPRTMGRDVFDALFLWGKTRPRLSYLSDRLGIRGGQELRSRLIERCRELDFDRLADEVEPFLFRPGDAAKVKFFPDFVNSREFGE